MLKLSAEVTLSIVVKSSKVGVPKALLERSVVVKLSALVKCTSQAKRR